MDVVKSTRRLESLDILRGLDLFVLVFFQPVFMHLAFAQPEGHFLREVFNGVFTHVEWEGFHLWDQVMPLFLFMAGTSIPYAFARYKEEHCLSSQVFLRVLKRVVLLWVFGAIVQGNLLDLNFDTLYLYTDTLQAIACGYLFSVLLYLCCSFRVLLMWVFLLPAVYTAGMLLAGGYAPGENLAEQIDRVVLGRFLYGASVADDGSVTFASWYHISWIYSSLNFVTTVLSGVLTGILLRTQMAEKRKVCILLAAGLGCLLCAGILSFVEPVIKRLWTSSMTFLSSGISVLLMAFFYYWIDVLKRGQTMKWLKVYGMNSILAYMLYNTFRPDSLLHYWLHGLEPVVGSYYPFVKELCFVSLIALGLSVCYRNRIFLKV